MRTDYSEVNPYQLMLGDSHYTTLTVTQMQKMLTSPMNEFTIAADYEITFDMDSETATKMAAWTKGCTFAYQTLGYYFWEEKGDLQKAYQYAFEYLAEYCYIKLWTELANNDQKLVYAIAQSKTNKNKEIRGILQWTSNYYNPYRMRLIHKGIINGDTYGKVFFTLPEFCRFLHEYAGFLNF